MFSDQNVNKLSFSSTGKFGQVTNMWKVNNTIIKH